MVTFYAHKAQLNVPESVYWMVQLWQCMPDTHMGYVTTIKGSSGTLNLGQRDVEAA